ncbi:retrotransposon protein, putative, ty1-copia subclass, partial [Tanacetum coccineum]
GDKSVEELQVEVELQRLNNHTPEEDQTYQEDGVDEDAGDQETNQPPDLTDYQLVRDREPRTRMKPLSSKWKTAMKEEMDSLKKKKTWELVDHPVGQKLVSCKWLFKIKEGIEGVQKPRYKARLVARGFTQRAVIDYNEVFSLVVRHTFIRVILALTACKDYELEQLDVKTAFLHGNLEEVIYMRHPPGYEQGNKVTRLRLGLPSLLKKEFGMKELREAKKVLGMEIFRDRSRKIMRVSQSGDRDVEKISKVSYANAVGSLMYLMVCMRPDIAARFIYRGIMFFMKGLSTSMCIITLSERSWKQLNKTVKVLNVGTEHNAVDALTNVVPGLKLQHCLELLNVVIMSSETSTVTYTFVYIDSEPGRAFWGADDEEICEGGIPWVIVLGYDGLPMQPVALPSLDYIPGPEDPQTPLVPQDEDEREPMFVQAHDPDYVPEPIYPEYIPLEDELEFPAKEQPLPPVDSPTTESPGYVIESDPEEDPEEYEDDETEDGPVDYPMDGGDDGDDDDGDLSGDDADGEDEDDEDGEEEEEHLAPADSAIVVPIDKPVFLPEGTEPVIPPPSTDITIGAKITVRTQNSISLPPEAERLARCTAPPAHSSPLLPSSGCPTQIQTFRIAYTQALIDVVTAALPSPSLPPSLYIPPPIDRRDDILESEKPPRKRL